MSRDPKLDTSDIPVVPPSAQRDAVVEDGLEVAEKALESGDLQAVEAMVRALTSFAPDEPRAWAMRARLQRARGALDAADQDEAKAILLMSHQIDAADPPLSLRERMLRFSQVVFLGGPADRFVELGQMQLAVMLEHGLEPRHKVLDIGCGALRAGLWLVKVLEPGGYFGIEPHRARLRFGVEHVLGPDLVNQRRPRFDHNAAFDFSVFGTPFDFFVARSVWTHASKPQILAMLDGFVQHGAPGAVMLTSFLAASSPEQDYQGEGWVGRSESSPLGGLVGHDPKWVLQVCRDRGLTVSALPEHVVNKQIWLKIQLATA